MRNAARRTLVVRDDDAKLAHRPSPRGGERTRRAASLMGRIGDPARERQYWSESTNGRFDRTANGRHASMRRISWRRAIARSPTVQRKAELDGGSTAEVGRIAIAADAPK